VNVYEARLRRESQAAASIEAGRRRVAARSATQMPWRPSVPIAALALAEAIFRGGERGQESDESLSDLAPDIVRYRSKRLEKQRRFR
jgi:hypothetical protein